MKNIGVFLVLLFAFSASAQKTIAVRLWIYSEEIGIPFASIVLPDGSGFSADEDGRCTIELHENTKVQISAIAHRSKTLLLEPRKQRDYRIELSKQDFELDPVVITGVSNATRKSESPVATQVIDVKQLQSIPGANLIQNLSQNNGIQEVVACGVCGTNEIRLNGMEGASTLVLIDGIPLMGALASVYGLNGIPSSLIEQVEVITGPASTQYGSEAMGGVVNIITKKSDKHLHGEIMSSFSTHQELNTNFNLRIPVSDRNRFVIAADLTRNWLKLDDNNDQFTDIPLLDQRSAFAKWTHKKGDFKSNIALRTLHEDRQAGELRWGTQDIGSEETYGEYIETRRSELLGNFCWKDWKGEGSLSSHFQESYYGETHFRANQNQAFFQLIRNMDWKKTDVQWGLSQRMQWYDDNTLFEQPKFQYIPGSFLQAQRKIGKNLDVLAGVRADHHQSHGLVFSPRLNLKYSSEKGPTLRLNAGTGFRVVNLFTEDHAALSGSRVVEIRENLRPEESWHLGLHLDHYFVFDRSYLRFEMSSFYTEFSNRIVPNFDIDPQLIVYENSNTMAHNYGLSSKLSWNFEGLKVDLGATYAINTSGNGEEREALLFSPPFTANAQVAYERPKWSVQVQSNFTGSMPLPEIPAPFARPDESDPFFQHHVKLAWKMNGAWTASLSVRNLSNYIQESPLIAPEAPFSDAFDTNYAYGPLQSRRLIFGLNYLIDGDKK